MRLLFVTDQYGKRSAGSVICWQTLIGALRVRGHTCLVLTETGEPVQNEHDIQTTSYEDLPHALSSLFATFRPDAVFSQPGWSWRTAFALRHSLIPHGYFVRLQNDWCNVMLREYPTDIVITHSQFSQHGIDTLFGVHSVVFPSFIAPIRPYPKKKRLYITTINPLRIKGGHIFATIAKAMPEKSFLAVCGWDSISEKPLHPINLPYYDGIDFSGIPNLQFVTSTSSMKEIYAQTAILLLPSIVSETFSRVAYEALAYGVPTIIASDLGAFPEILGRFGILIDNFTNPDAWIQAIQSTKTKRVQADIYKQRTHHLRQYALDPAVDRFEKLLLKQVTNNKTFWGRLRKFGSIARFQIKRAMYYRW